MGRQEGRGWEKNEKETERKGAMEGETAEEERNRGVMGRSE